MQWTEIRRAAMLAACLVMHCLGASYGESVRLAVTDIVGLEELQREFGAFRSLLSEATGFDVEFFPVSNRTAAVEVLKSQKAEFVLTGPAEYVVFRKRTNAYPVVGFSRPDYFSAIIVLAEKDITDLDSLKGKKVTFGAVGSTSKHLAPMQLLKDHGMDPFKDIEAIHIADNVAWEASARGLALYSSVTTWCHVCRPYPMCCMGHSLAPAPPSGAASFEKVWLEPIAGKAIATPQRRMN